MAQSEWKHFKRIKKPNVALEGDLEIGAKPWTPIVFVKFKLKPTPFAEETFNEEVHELHMALANAIGLPSLTKAIRGVIQPGWRFYTVAYAYEHNPKKFSFGKQSDFQVNAYLIAPKKFEDTSDWKGLQKEFVTQAEKIAKLPNFQSTDMWEIKS